MNIQSYLKLKQVGVGFSSKFRATKLNVWVQCNLHKYWAVTYSLTFWSGCNLICIICCIQYCRHMKLYLILKIIFQNLWDNEFLVDTSVFLFGGLGIIFNQACNAYITSIAGSLFLSQNHRMVGVGRDLCGSSSPTLLPKQSHLEQAAQDLF